MLYVMDRALGMKEKDAYEQFKDDVRRMFEHSPERAKDLLQNSETGDIPMPSEAFLENICDPIVEGFSMEERERVASINETKKPGIS